MSGTRPAALALAVAVAAGGAASAMEVENRHAPGADFSAYHAFDHLPRQGTDDRSRFAPGSDYDRRVRAALERRLADRGFRRVDADPDFLVAYSLGRKEVLDTSGARHELAPGLNIAWEEGELVRAYTEGTLLVEVVDAGSRETVWVGWATEVVDDPDALLEQPERLMKKIDKALRRILRRFPPRE